MTKQLLTGAEILVDEIHKQGIEYIFGYPGGAAIPMFDALVDSLIRRDSAAVNVRSRRKL